MIERFYISTEDQNKRLDLFLAEKLNISRSKAQELIENGSIKINDSFKTKSYNLKKDDRVEVLLCQTEDEGAKNMLLPENIPLEILYRDEFLVVISKTPGMVVYPSLGHPRGTVMNALAYQIERLATVGGPLRPGVVHRLDKDTSGALIIAINDEAYYRIVEAFKERKIEKEYIALVYGRIKDSGKITSPIGRSPSDRKKMSTKAKTSKEAISEWTVMKRFRNSSLIKVKIITGRTHQIRVHFSSIGHPVLGDQIYGKKTYLELKKGKIRIPRQMLHAYRVEFTHPIKGEKVSVEAPLPEDMKKIIMTLEEDYGFDQ